MSYADRARELGYVPFMGNGVVQWMKPTEDTKVVDGHVVRKWACSKKFRFNDRKSMDAAMEGAAAQLVKEEDGHQQKPG